MKIYCKGTAQVRSSQTGKVYDFESSELDWQMVDSCERAMGPEYHYEAEVEHAELGLLTWNVWEHPEGIENQKSSDLSGHELVRDFSYGLEHEMPAAEEWLSYEVPRDPYSIFMKSYHQTGELLAERGSRSGSSILNRMIFSHQITALEAFLGDTLFNGVMNDSTSLQRLILNADELKDAKFTLNEIANTPNLVRNAVQKYLRGLLYHNLGKADRLYQIAFGFGILKLAEDRSALFNAVTLRHDCVHRNGFDKDGDEIEVFSSDFVQATADLIHALVISIRQAMLDRADEE